ncbi:MAG: hypothetical protein AAFX85_07645 [Pseudomonadota bacterium]
MDNAPSQQANGAARAAIDSRLASVAEVTQAIEEGRILWIAGDDALLRQLPRGRWIGGSIPYFMTRDGGSTSREQLYVRELDETLTERIQIRFYDSDAIDRIAADAPETGLTILLIPANSEAHLRYAREAPDFEDMFLKPVVGWITGVHLDDLGRESPTVYNGVLGSQSSTDAVAMHITLPAGRYAEVGIVNTLRQGDGDEFEFSETGFVITDCLVNGVKRNLCEYMKSHDIDTRYPLVADYSGAMINVSFQELDEAQRTVTLYAPVFAGVKYRIASPLHDYVSDFAAAVPDLGEDAVFSCNCILNYLYSELEGKRTGEMTGPMTFGEIAYQLLNQTMVYVTIRQY